MTMNEPLDDDEKRTGGRGLSESTVAKARALAEKLLTERYDGNQSRMAEALDMSQPSVSRVMRGGGIDFRTAIVIARAAGVHPAELLVEELGPPVEEASRFPNLDIAIQFGRADNPSRWPKHVVASARGGCFGQADAKPSAWLHRLDELTAVCRDACARILAEESQH